jgi:hypothetical protein
MNTSVLFTKCSEIQALYPETKDLYMSYKRGFGCISCRRRRLFKKVVALVEKKGSRGNINHILNIDINKQDTSIFNRVECENCVEKHLCQAYILLNEVQAGYTEHYALAQAHYQEAQEEGCRVVMEMRIDNIDGFKHMVKQYLKLPADTILLIGNLACAEDRLKDRGLLEEAQQIRKTRLKIQDVTEEE